MHPDALFWLALAVKMAVTAAFVVAATVTAERAGAFIGALVATLPISAGPSFVFLSLDHPPEFIALGALYGFAGNIATAFFMLVYVLLAQRHGLAISVSAALATWFAIAALERQMTWTLFTALAVSVVVFPVCILFTRDYRSAPMPPVRRQWYDIPLRALLVALLVGAVVSLSFQLGPEKTGILVAAPVVMTSIMTLLHWRIGGRAAAAVIANSIAGSAGLSACLATLYLTAVPLGLPAGFIVAVSVAIAWNLSLYALSRRQAAV